MEGCAWDDAVRMSRGGTVYERVKKVRNATGDADSADGVCKKHGDPLQFALWWAVKRRTLYVSRAFVGGRKGFVLRA